MRSVTAPVWTLLLSLLAPCHLAGIFPSVRRTGEVKSFTLVIRREVLPGFKHRQVTVNGSVPGPTLRVNVGDMIRVTVVNDLRDEGTAIHWHGMSLQDRPWMDGVVGLTQCAIPNAAGNNSFTYEFLPQAAGTFWYHGHFNSQNADGLYGALVVLNSTHSVTYAAAGAPYDVDNDTWTFMAADNYQTEVRLLMTSFLGNTSFGFDPVPDAFTVNNYFSQKLTIYASKASRVRMRIINAAASSAFSFSIDNVSMQIIELDGVHVEPLIVNSVELHTAQRASVVVDWSQHDRPFAIFRVLFLPFIYPQYDAQAPHFNLFGSTSHLPLNLTWTANVIFTDSSAASLPTIEATAALHSSRAFSFTLRKDQNYLEARPLHFNAIPPANYMIRIVSEFLIDEGDFVRAFLNSGTYGDAEAHENFRRDKPLLYSYLSDSNNSLALKPVIGPNNSIQGSGSSPFILPYGAVIDLYIDGYCCGTHPFHLHGHHFWILATSERPDATESFAGRYMARDVVTVPFGGWALLRFVADNPGVWLFHCHLHWHLAMGLAAIFIEAPEILQQGHRDGQYAVEEEHQRICLASSQTILRSETLQPSGPPSYRPTPAPALRPSLTAVPSTPYPSCIPLETPSLSSSYQPTRPASSWNPSLSASPRPYFAPSWWPSISPTPSSTPTTSLESATIPWSQAPTLDVGNTGCQWFYSVRLNSLGLSQMHLETAQAALAKAMTLIICLTPSNTSDGYPAGCNHDDNNAADSILNKPRWAVNPDQSTVTLSIYRNISAVGFKQQTLIEKEQLRLRQSIEDGTLAEFVLQLLQDEYNGTAFTVQIMNISVTAVTKGVDGILLHNEKELSNSVPMILHVKDQRFVTLGAEDLSAVLPVTLVCGFWLLVAIVYRYRNCIREQQPPKPEDASENSQRSEEQCLELSADSNADDLDYGLIYTTNSHISMDP